MDMTIREDVPRFDDQVFPKSAIDFTENHTCPMDMTIRDDVPRFDDQVFPKSAIDFTEEPYCPIDMPIREDVPRFDDQVFPKRAIDFTKMHTARWICQLERMCQDSTIKCFQRER
ncbi:hypothetical protein OIU76_000690 [Salix suchowensis]|nr:hypothetical protein OIU76_000690 [Salix suchowensis]